MLALVVLVAGASSASCAGDRPAATSGGGGSGGSEAGVPSISHMDASVAPPPLATAHALGLVPRPRTATTCAGSLAIDGSTEIVVGDDPASRAVGLRLGQWLGIGASLVRTIAPGAPGPARAIVLRLEPSASPRRDPSVVVPADTNEESYTLDVTPERALLRAKHPAGLFYGAQTIAQLAGSRPLLAAGASASGALPAASPFASRPLPCAHIEDAPAYRVRAMHLDVVRHFFSKELVERYVDLLSFYRFNVFHWHLTDDQGFRLAIRSHPELTQVGARRIEEGKEHAGSYSQDDAREVVAFAKERFVTVVPEIEMPGHARAILASHPELSCTGKKQEVPSTWGVFDDVLCAGNEGTYALLGDVIKETTEVFPSQLVHLGGDEVPKARWNACPKCRARMARDKLSAEQLQGAFMKRVGTMLAARGRRMLAWDEALEGGLTADGVVVAWQSRERGRAAALAGHDVVMAPSGTSYFNYWQTRGGKGPGHEGFTPWTAVLGADPMPEGLDAAQAAHVLGGEGALWTEHVKTVDDLDTLLLPRLAALSESLWSTRSASPVASDEASFAARFTAQRALLDANHVRYFVEPPVGLRARKVFLDTTSLVIAPPAIHPDGVVRYTLDGTDPVATSPIFGAPVTLAATTTASARLFLPGGRTSAVVRGTLEHVKLHPPIHPSMEPEMFKEGVHYKYFEGDFHALPDFTDGARLVAKRSGRLGGVGFDPTFRPERFAVLYDAWFRAPADGVYRFVVRADDGVWLEIDGERIVVDDGEHAPREAEGEIALEQGPHTVRLGYFQGGGGKHLALRCEGPSLPLGKCAVVSP